MNPPGLSAVAAMVFLGIAAVLPGGEGHGTATARLSDGQSVGTESARTFTDMVGRTVRVPGRIGKVYCTSPVGTILVYTLCPEKLAGWNYTLSASERTYIRELYRDLPVLGGWFGRGGTANVEAIVAAHPDVILSMGTTDTLSIGQSERLQAQSGIPVLIMGGALGQLDEVYEFAGRLLDAPARAGQLAAYCRETYAGARAAAAAIPPAERVRVYYAEGPRGLETDPGGSYHAEILDLVGAVNVAAVPAGAAHGRVAVSMEQLMSWNPDVIIVGYNGGREPALSPERLAADPAWSQLTAVKQGRVFLTPQEPFNWFDRPPSVNRVIGIKWIGHLLYPNLFPGGLRREVRDFYDMFYHVQLTDNQADDLLKRAMPARGGTSP